MVEDLDTLEAVMGRPLPQAMRDDLDAAARCNPVTDEMRQAGGPRIQPHSPGLRGVGLADDLVSAWR